MGSFARACLCALLLVGCTAADQPADGPQVRDSVAAGLMAGVEGLNRAQVRTFRADLRSGWVAAYDPADPPGCIPGGLRNANKTPCTAYILQRRKTRWAVVGTGTPGAMFVPDGVPADLGAPAKLQYLAE